MNVQNVSNSDSYAQLARLIQEARVRTASAGRTVDSVMPKAVRLAGVNYAAPSQMARPAEAAPFPAARSGIFR
ncbi:MAG: hypothetical protein MUF22_03745, partial [Chitinispirillaceae bacterium]|nr:hypothetical protein [Chitinispirillaceae bacterium]